jgi:hypothetical protein
MKSHKSIGLKKGNPIIQTNNFVKNWEADIAVKNWSWKSFFSGIGFKLLIDIIFTGKVFW